MSKESQELAEIMSKESKYGDNTKEELCKMLGAYERVLDRKEERHAAEIAELLGKLETKTTLEVENLKRNEIESENVIRILTNEVERQKNLNEDALYMEKQLKNDIHIMRGAFRAYEASTPRETRLTDEYQRFNIDFWAYTGK